MTPTPQDHPTAFRPMPSLPRTTLAIAALALIGACSSGETRGASADAAGGTLIVTPVNDAVTVFPPLVGELTGKMVQDLVFDRLAEIDSALTTTDDRSFSPRLAKTWTWAPDSMSIAFTLDPRARWHDGAPVTASDVRYSFRAFMDPKVGSPTAPTLSNIDSVSVRDSATAVVWFKRRSPEQFYDVAYQLVIIPEHVYGKIPFDQLEHSDAIKTPIGTGRFRFVKWEPGVRMDFGVSMGVRQGEKAWRELVQQALDRSRGDISQLLLEYGIPMVDEKGEPVR